MLLALQVELLVSSEGIAEKPNSFAGVDRVLPLLHVTHMSDSLTPSVQTDLLPSEEVLTNGFGELVSRLAIQCEPVPLPLLAEVNDFLLQVDSTALEACDLRVHHRNTFLSGLALPSQK